DVDGGGGVIADQDHAQAGPGAAGGELGDGGAQLFANLARGPRAVEQGGGHAFSWLMRAARSAACSSRASATDPPARAAITATPATPALTTSCTFAREMPPMATSGRSVRRQAEARRAVPTTGSGFSLLRVAKTGPSAM